MRFLLFFLFFGLTICSTFAQTQSDSLLRLLINERTRLYRDWDYFQKQNHALFGGKSKKDLRNVIATLEGLIAKDNQVLARLRHLHEQEKLRLEMEKVRLTTKTGDLTTQTNSFLGESNELTERLQKFEARLKAERALRKEAEARTERIFQIAVGIVLAVLVLGGLVWQRTRSRRA
ncbi:MAG: hypothetical protein LH606_04955 [Cytophagaceae bacterium]|nr:hypothetical protein [Cytophagaceae bacterium]